MCKMSKLQIMNNENDITLMQKNIKEYTDSMIELIKYTEVLKCRVNSIESDMKNIKQDENYNECIPGNMWVGRNGK